MERKTVFLVKSKASFLKYLVVFRTAFVNDSVAVVVYTVTDFEFRNAGPRIRASFINKVVAVVINAVTADFVAASA